MTRPNPHRSSDSMFLVCGEALFDLFAQGPPGPGGRLAMEAVPGGSPFNVAIGLVRLGTPTGLLAGVSHDALGRQLLGRLEDEGVSTGYVVPRPERTTLSLVTRGEDGSPVYSFYGDGGADTALSSSDLPAPGPGIAGIHIGSYSIAAPPIADALAALAARMRERLVVLDPNVRLGVLPDAALWRARIEALLPHVGAVKASEEDLALLWPGRDIGEIAGDWLALGPRLVVITRGGEGATGYRRGERLAAPSAPVAVVDTVGAGDAFQAALIDGLLRAGARSASDIAGLSSRTLWRLLERCVKAGALTCTRRGADPPRQAELMILRSD